MKIISVFSQPDAKPFYAENEKDIWEKFKSGNLEVFSKIYQQHIKSLYNYGLTFTRDKDVVQDCVQDLFIYIWNTKENLGTTDNIKYYLFKALRRSILQKLASEERFENITKKQTDQELVQFSAEYLLIADQVAEEQKTMIFRAMKALNPLQYEAIYLKFFDNLSFEQVAEIMVMDKKATYKLISKAIEVLRKHSSFISAIFFLLNFF